MHAYVRVSITVNKILIINRTRDRSVPNCPLLLYFITTVANWPVLQLIVGWFLLLLYYSYKNDNKKKCKRMERERKRTLIVEFSSRRRGRVIVYKGWKGEKERVRYKMIHTSAPPMAVRGVAVTIHDPCLPLHA